MSLSTRGSILSHARSLHLARRIGGALGALLLSSDIIDVALAQGSELSAPAHAERQAYYGDLHLHTSYSADAYLLYETTVSPEDAYRFARGEAVNYRGQTVKRREPLDFLAITDHAEQIGVFNQLEDLGSALSRTQLGKRVSEGLRRATTGTMREVPWPKEPLPDPIKSEWEATTKSESASAWERYIDSANRNYAPGKFTTFIAYEWTSTPDGNNLHRNVIFKGNAAPSPFTASDSAKPEDLWSWLETIRAKGFEALAIPHNGNRSNGLMYDWLDSNGQPINLAYAQSREANEPLTEISQIKGASETHPSLSPNDEFASFEILDQIGISATLSRPPGSYVRDALSRGLVMQRKIGANPYKYGLVGGSDLHTGLSTNAQPDYYGHEGRANMGGGRPAKEQAAGALGQRSQDAGLVYDIPMLKTTAGNLTGVWAEDNTRSSIYNALRRKETFATSGTRLKLRLFGGWGFKKTLLKHKDWVDAAYRRGVPMGGNLTKKPGGVAAPTFAAWALKDPNGANLDRVQVIKVWEKDGRQMEKVFDVVWSGDRTPDSTTGKLPAIGNTANLTTGRYSNNIGAVELKTVWKDPEFDSGQAAAYYLRVLEIPTPRWSTLLAIEHSLPVAHGVPATEQQRGWSSPIWYSPPR